MNTKPNFKRPWKTWMILVGIMLALLLCLFWYLLLEIFQPGPSSDLSASTAMVTIFPYQTFTPTVELSTLFTPTPISGPISSSDIAIGGYVQITGTGGVGLHIRSGPGTSYDSKFIGMDSEVFKVQDGPQDADGFTWWYIVAPYDANRSGWAVSNYLIVIVQ
jgi:hypothetical protein